MESSGSGSFHQSRGKSTSRHQVIFGAFLRENCTPLFQSVLIIKLFKMLPLICTCCTWKSAQIWEFKDRDKKQKITESRSNYTLQISELCWITERINSVLVTRNFVSWGLGTVQLHQTKEIPLVVRCRAKKKTNCVTNIHFRTPQVKFRTALWYQHLKLRPRITFSSVDNKDLEKIWSWLWIQNDTNHVQILL